MLFVRVSVNRSVVANTVVYARPKTLVTAAVRGPAGAAGAVGPAGDGAFTLLADRSLGGHRLIISNGANGLDYADCTVTDALQMLGMTSHAVSAGDEVGVVRFGEITESSWNWTPGLPVYLGRDGVPTQTLPAEAIISVIVGIPTNPTTLFMAPREPIRLN